MLSDAEQADKTVWPPMDDAFTAVREVCATMPDEEIKAILGYHISAPRRALDGAYPIVNPQFLMDAGHMTHRTRTGVLTGSDQRTQTTFADGVLMIEGAQIAGTAWSAQAGSVFSLDAVIMDVGRPSTGRRGSKGWLGRTPGGGMGSRYSGTVVPSIDENHSSRTRFTRQPSGRRRSTAPRSDRAPARRRRRPSSNARLRHHVHVPRAVHRANGVRVRVIQIAVEMYIILIYIERIWSLCRCPS
ncbi:MAG: fasciclin domain-containing protein [Spirochaetaceae bacterium]